MEKFVYGLISLVVFFAIPGASYACGMPLGATIPSEQALIIYTNGRQEIITSVQLESEQAGAAVIFPVPGVPEVDVLKNDDLFRYLEEVTRPTEQVKELIVWGAPQEGMAGGAGVQVLGREVIGDYDVARLSAGESGELQRWLDLHGYTIAAGAGPILDQYIAQKWTFVAVKLAQERAASGMLRPIRIAFETQQIVYPMRFGSLAQQPLDVLLYVLADQRVEIPEMETQYAGPVDKLDRPPPAELAGLFRAPFLTKLRNSQINPATLRDDFVIRPMAASEPFRQVVVRNLYVNGWDRMARPIFGLALVLASSSMAFWMALALRRRIIQIAGPEPDEDD